MGTDLTRWLIAQDAPTSAVVRPAVTPLSISGVGIYQAGTIWKYRAVTAFRGPELYARGERGWIGDYYARCLDVGANTVRWFLMWNNTGYSPHASAFKADYYEDLEDALLDLKALGLYAHVVIFCDQVPGSAVWMQTTDGRHDEAAQLDHLRRVVAIAKRTGNVLLEINNEDFKNGELSARFDPAEFAGTLATRSSWPETAPPSDPQICGTWLQWSTKHLERTFDWARKGKVLYEISFEGLGAFPPARIPAISGEPQRIGDGTSPRCHADNAACCEIMGAGTCLHGGFSSIDPSHDSDFQNCRWTGSPNALACADAVGAVWKSSVLDPRCGITESLVRGTEFDDGPCPVHHRDRYNTDSPHNEPDTGANRTYFKVFENGTRFFGLSVDPAPQWPGYQTRDATIVNRGGWDGDGHGGNLLECRR